MKWSFLYLFILCVLFTISIKPQTIKQHSDTSGNVKIETEEFSAIKEEMKITEDNDVRGTNIVHTYDNERFISLRYDKIFYKN